MAPETAGQGYLRALLAVSGALLLIVALINLIVDPFDVSQLVRIDRLNSSRPKELDNARLKKPIDVWRRRYDGIILGTSQVERAMDPTYSALRNRGVTFYNSGLSGLGLHEVPFLLRNAIETSGVRFALISLDFQQYFYGDRAGEVPRNWSRTWQVAEYLKSLVSLTTLSDSISTARASWSHTTHLQHLPSGLLNMEDFLKAYGIPEYSSSFDQTDDIYVNQVYASIVAQRDGLQQAGLDHTYLIRILDVARAYRIQVSLFVPPVHAREMEVIEYLGLMPLYRQWLSEVVCILESDSGIAVGGSRFALWDFSGYNSVTTELLPAKGNGSVRMAWYYDPIHYSRRAGNAILNRVLDLRDPEFSMFVDFGIQLRMANLDQHLAAVAKARERYVKEFPEVPRMIAALHRGPQPNRTSRKVSPLGKDCRPESARLPVPAR